MQVAPKNAALLFRNSEVFFIISGLLVELVPIVLDVAFVHLFYPILRRGRFDKYAT